MLITKSSWGHSESLPNSLVRQDHGNVFLLLLLFVLQFYIVFRRLCVKHFRLIIFLFQALRVNIPSVVPQQPFRLTKPLYRAGTSKSPAVERVRYSAECPATFFSKGKEFIYPSTGMAIFFW